MVIYHATLICNSLSQLCMVSVQLFCLMLVPSFVQIEQLSRCCRRWSLVCCFLILCTYVSLVDWLFFYYRVFQLITQLLFADHSCVQMMWFESLNLSSCELQIVSGELSSVVTTSDPSVLNTTHCNHCSVSSCTCSLRHAGVMRNLSSFEWAWQHSVAHLCCVSWKELASVMVPFGCYCCSDVWYVFVTHMIDWLIDYSSIIVCFSWSCNFYSYATSENMCLRVSFKSS